MESREIHVKSSTLKPLEFENSKFSSAFDFRLTERDLEIAYHELNEREHLTANCIQKLKERLERDEEMLYRTDDSYLLGYLRYAKFNCDKAYNSLRKLHSLRIKNPEFFIFPPNLETMLNTNILTCLPYKDGRGRIIFRFDHRKWKADVIPYSEIVVAFTTINDVILENPHSQIKGIVLIWDFQGLTLRQVSQMLQPSMQRMTANLLQDCYPYRISQIFAINCNAVMKAAYAASRFLIKDKILQRVKMLGSDLTELHQNVEPAVLPKDYGGTLDEMECSITDIIMDNLDYLRYERSFGLKASNKHR